MHNNARESLETLHFMPCVLPLSCPGLHINYSIIELRMKNVRTSLAITLILIF